MAKIPQTSKMIKIHMLTLLKLENAAKSSRMNKATYDRPKYPQRLEI